MGRAQKRAAGAIASVPPRSFFLAATLLLSLAAALASAAQAAQAPAIGAPAVGFDLKTLDGEEVRPEKFRGKPLIVNFFASWCDPCRDEMPVLNALAARSGGADAQVLGIAVQDSRAALAEFAGEFGIRFPIAMDLNSKAQRAYRVFGPPATFFIDSDGVLRDIVLGPMTPARAREALMKARMSK